MSDVFSPLDSGPSWGVMTDRDVLDRARNLPTGYGEMVLDTIKESFITSPGLGTAIRDVSTPERVQSRDVVTPPELEMRDPLEVPQPGVDQPFRIQPPAGTWLETEDEYQVRRKRAGALSKEEWEASPNFRTGIAYDPGMTQDRAAALASWYDASKVRQDTIAKGPGGFLGTSLWLGGMVVGGAADPVNYIPIFGPEVRAAQIAKFGRLGGSVLTSAADAALNTAAASALTAGTRASFGDEVTWQGFLTDVAISAVIGGAFGAATSRWEGWQTSRTANELERVVEARRALNDALDDLVHDRPVEITPAVQDAVEKAYQQLEPARVQMVRENPADVISERVRRANPELVARDENLARQERVNRETITELVSEIGDDETFGPLRRAMIEVEQASEARTARLNKLEAALEKTDSKKQRAKLQEQIDAIRSEPLPELPPDISPELIDRLSFLEESLALRQKALDSVVAQRAEIAPAIDELRTRTTADYWAEGSRVSQAEQDIGDFKGSVGPVPVTERMDVAAPRVETPDPAITQATSRVGKPAKDASEEFGIDLKPVKPAPEPTKKSVKAVRGENGRISGLEIEGGATNDLAKQFGINAKTGDFPEMAEFDQLVALGRVTPEELAAVQKAADIEMQSNAYANALEAAAICRVGL